MEILQKAALNTLIGMGTVFAVLIVISLIIYCFKYIPVLEKKFSKKKRQQQIPVPKAPSPLPAVPARPAAPAPEETWEDDLALVAVITAAIAAQSGSSPDGFVVRSIRRRSRA
jgi:sodium pump decarboxylase gamma subunit